MVGQKTIKQLLIHSEYAFISSIKEFNDINNPYRLEGFTFFIINSWELLLKSKIIKDSKDVLSIYYGKRKREKSLSLIDCLNKVFDYNSPIKKNIETIDKLRNQAIHFIIPETEYIYIGLFQSCIINYCDCIFKWFEIDVKSKFSPGMLAILNDYKKPDIITLKNKYPIDIINNFKNIEKEIETTSMDSTRYCIPFEYKITISKNANKSDIFLSLSNETNDKAIIINSPKDIATTHPYRQIDISNKIKEIFPNIRFNLFTFRAFRYNENISNNQKYYYYIEKGNLNLYSEDCLLLLIERIRNDENYISFIEDKFKKHLKNEKRDRPGH